MNSQVFDHTSLIRFIEARFGEGNRLTETNITPWRRTVVGDLTSAFDFQRPNDAEILLPGTDTFKPPDFTRFYKDFNVNVPGKQGLPKQEPGVRPARALPYVLDAYGQMEASGGKFFRIDFSNTGRATAVFQVRSGSDAHVPRTYTLEPKNSLSDTWNFGLIGVANCDLSVYGANGFFRGFKGDVLALSRAQLDVRAEYGDGQGNFRDGARDITLVITNNSSRNARIYILDKYSGRSVDYVIKPKGAASDQRSLDRTFNWYDLVITVDTEPSLEYHFAGHVENGKDSVSDPWLGAV